MRQPMRRRLLTALMAAGLVGGMVLSSPSALGQPDVPPPPAPVDPAVAFAPPPVDPAAAIVPPVDPMAPPPPPAAPFGFPPPPAPADPMAPPPPPFAGPPGFPGMPAQPMAIPEGTPAGQNPTPFVGEPPFLPPSFNPTNGAKAGAAKPIYINFQRPIANRQMAQDAVHITELPVPGRFYWVTDTQLRWRPQDFWPTGPSSISTPQAPSRGSPSPSSWWPTSTTRPRDGPIMRDGEVEKTFPVSMGKTGQRHQERHLLRAGEVRRHRDGLVDVRRAGGFRRWIPAQGQGRRAHRQQRHLRARCAVVDRLQGDSNVSHGCINLSPADASGSTTTSAVVTRWSSPIPTGHLQPARRSVGLADVLADAYNAKIPRSFRPSVPDPHPLLRFEVQRVGLVDLECVVERVHVPDNAVAPELRR